MNKIEKNSNAILISTSKIKGAFELLKTLEGQRAPINMEKNTKNLIERVIYNLEEKYKDKIVLLEHKFLGYNLYDISIEEDFYYDYSLLDKICKEKKINFDKERYLIKSVNSTFALINNIKTGITVYDNFNSHKNIVEIMKIYNEDRNIIKLNSKKIPNDYLLNINKFLDNVLFSIYDLSLNERENFATSKTRNNAKKLIMEKVNGIYYNE